MDEEMTYEKAKDELTAIVTKLESGGVPLAESLELWERGEQLATICQQWLDNARNKVESARAVEASDREASDRPAQ